ncbi:hypothetical protein [Streptomyces griseoviridis]|uniref:Uncharacterized protein n=1 Tax=Streptomyces griseoviridis TaxID=45398 RepID=A0ABT9LF98_STRGD|nr:hypothetical protein [Streptomyces griseoviridis]MDP9682394.1 hypothetical protein [Streptomyces griseoviridis]GGS81788.1 hypothetical protein GCM10010240_13930 [Streptomyces griseoviridis]
MTTEPRPYTDDDLRAEAAVCLLALSTTPSTTDIRRWLPGAYVDSHRQDDDSSYTWGDLLGEDRLGEVAAKIHALIENAAHVTRWAVDLGADGLEPSPHTLNLDGDGHPLVRIHMAFHPDMDERARQRFGLALARVMADNL